MQLNDTRLHFKMLEVYQGFGEGEGFLSVNEKKLHLEFQVKDSLFGVIKSDPKTLEIPISLISNAKYVRNLFMSRLVFTVNDLELLSQFPSAKNGQIKVKIRRRDKETALLIAGFLQGRRVEKRLDDVTYHDPFLGN